MDLINRKGYKMGTRSITTVKDENGNKIIEMYQQYDGYPSGVGKDLFLFINSKKMVNGIGSDKNVFNGINCFAAQLVTEFKDGAGNTYLHAPTKDHKNKKKYWDLYCAEFYYEITSDLNIKAWDTLQNIEVTNKILED